MNRIPLETRITRIRSGMCSAPEHILPGLRSFAGMPVMKMISLMFSDLEKSFTNHMYLHYQKSPASITYGDLAVLIANDYLNNGIRNDRHIDALILFYCSCFEFETCYQNAVKQQGLTITRDQYLERLGLQDIKGIIDLRVDEYLEVVRKLDLPESTAKRLYAFSIEKAGLMAMSLQTIYRLMSEHALCKDIRLNDPISAGYPANSILIRRQLVELLIMPLACLVSENSNEELSLRKETEYEFN